MQINAGTCTRGETAIEKGAREMMSLKTMGRNADDKGISEVGHQDVDVVRNETGDGTIFLLKK